MMSLGRRTSHQRPVRSAARVLGAVFLPPFWLLCPASTASRTLRVPADYPVIQSAIVAASPGDTVLVGPGLYNENLDTQGKWLALVSEAGPASTVVDGGGRDRVVNMIGGGLVQGFTLQRGRHDGAGGGIWAYAPTTIRNNIIRDNVVGSTDQGSGGGIAIQSEGGGLIEDNQITGNYAGDEGGGVWARGTIVIRNNLIAYNRADVAGAGASVTLFGSVMSGNLVRGNVALYFAAGILAKFATIESNTVVENFNESNFIHAAGIDFLPPGSIRRNIIAYNGGTAGSGGGVGCRDVGAIIECNDSWGNESRDFVCDTTGHRNFSIDPLFCARATGDFHIATLSPCAPSGPSGCGLIGAFDVHCNLTPTRKTTWGSLKSRYR